MQYTQLFMKLQIRANLQEDSNQSIAKYFNGIWFQLQDELAFKKLCQSLPCLAQIGFDSSPQCQGAQSQQIEQQVHISAAERAHLMQVCTTTVCLGSYALQSVRKVQLYSTVCCIRFNSRHCFSRFSKFQFLDQL